jgi:hypothetical protein
MAERAIRTVVIASGIGSRASRLRRSLLPSSLVSSWSPHGSRVVGDPILVALIFAEQYIPFPARGLCSRDSIATFRAIRHLRSGFAIVFGAHYLRAIAYRNAVAVAALEPVGGALRGSPTAGFRIWTPPIQAPDRFGVDEALRSHIRPVVRITRWP